MRLLSRKSRAPFEVVGEVPGDWVADLARVADALRRHPWGGASLDLLLYGELPGLLERHMPPARFAEWQRSYRDGRVAVTGAINFVTADGRRAAAVPPVRDRATFLMLAGHETVEAALRRRQPRGSRPREETRAAAAHVLWTEYAVERTRRQIFDALRLGYSRLDNGLVSKQVEQIARELPEMVVWGVAHGSLPSRLPQLWHELARVYAMSLGRADEGSPDDRADLTAFRGHELVRESARGWDALALVLRRAYVQPHAPAEGLDALVLAEGWTRLYEGGLRAVWAPRYAAAAAERQD